MIPVNSSWGSPPERYAQLIWMESYRKSIAIRAVLGGFITTIQGIGALRTPQRRCAWAGARLWPCRSFPSAARDPRGEHYLFVCP